MSIIFCHTIFLYAQGYMHPMQGIFRTLTKILDVDFCKNC